LFPNVAQPKESLDFRPISITSILSRLVEKIIVRKYLLYALPQKDIQDQFAYKPTGSTTAALIAVTHHVTQMLESSSYVRCVLVDYSKAFDTINHSRPILFLKLGKLSLSSNILSWIYHFLTGRKQAVVANGHVSKWLPISQSIVRGSGLGPYLYIIYAADL